MKNPLKRPMNEQKVLDKLGIEDFRHLTKDKVVEFISLIPEMDPEVAKAAIVQFPEFAGTMKSIMIDYKQEIETAIKSNDNSMKACQDAAKSLMASLDRMLQENELSYEEKIQIIDKMTEIQKMLFGKDTENKKFIRDIVAVAGFVVVAVAGVTSSLLGGNSNFKLPTKKE